jgi:hypothetical protein
MFTLIPTQENTKLFFMMEGKTAERHGAIGSIAMDFGCADNESWSSWFEIQPCLKTDSYQTEFDNVINSLREDGNNPPFASRKNLQAFCSSTPSKDLSGRGLSYMIRTNDYSYYFRCQPGPHYYNACGFAYDNRFLLPKLAGQHEMPDECYSVKPSTGELVKIVLGEQGYYRSKQSTLNRETNRQIANENNALLKVTRAQEESMFVGSMFGWEVPAAKPWKYDRHGKLYR